MKQVIVVNRSLSLPKGKLAAQVAHAAVGAFITADEQAQLAWLQAGMPKIVVYAADAVEVTIHIVVDSPNVQRVSMAVGQSPLAILRRKRQREREAACRCSAYWPPGVLCRRYAANGHGHIVSGGSAALHPRLFKGHRSAIAMDGARWDRTHARFQHLKADRREFHSVATCLQTQGQSTPDAAAQTSLPAEVEPSLVTNAHVANLPRPHRPSGQAVTLLRATIAPTEPPKSNPTILSQARIAPRPSPMLDSDWISVTLCNML